MPKSRHATAIFSPSSGRPMNFRLSSMGLHTFQGILRSPQKARLCNPCVRNELSPFSQVPDIANRGPSRALELHAWLVRVCDDDANGLKSAARITMGQRDRRDGLGRCAEAHYELRGSRRPNSPFTGSNPFSPAIQFRY